MPRHYPPVRKNAARPTPQMVWNRRKRLAQYQALLPSVLSRIEALGLSNDELEKLVTTPQQALKGMTIRECLCPTHIRLLDRALRSVLHSIT